MRAEIVGAGGVQWGGTVRRERGRGRVGGGRRSRVAWKGEGRARVGGEVEGGGEGSRAGGGRMGGEPQEGCMSWSWS